MDAKVLKEFMDCGFVFQQKLYLTINGTPQGGIISPTLAWEMLRRWAKRRHPNKTKNWIVNKYWRNHKGRNWYFVSKENVLFYMSDMPIIRYPQLRLGMNPFLGGRELEKALSYPTPKVVDDHWEGLNNRRF